MNNQKGMSLVELLLASTIVLVSFGATFSFVLGVKKKTENLLNSRSRSVQIQKLAQNILADPKLFRVNFDPSEAEACRALADGDLPLVWDNINVYDKEDCPGCQGKLGFVVQPFPLPSIRGVYLVTIRVSHPTLTKDSSAVCNGVTVTGVEQLQMIVGLR